MNGQSTFLTTTQQSTQHCAHLKFKEHKSTHNQKCYVVLQGKSCLQGSTGCFLPQSEWSLHPPPMIRGRSTPGAAPQQMVCSSRALSASQIKAKYPLHFG
eukprot:15363322-Ditylum_brightwellii.AAC.1